MFCLTLFKLESHHEQSNYEISDPLDTIGEIERRLFENKEELSLYLWIIAIFLLLILLLSIFAIFRVRRLFTSVRVFRRSNAIQVSTTNCTQDCALINVSHDDEDSKSKRG